MGDTNILVTISGPPAAGTSTVAGRLSDEIGFEHISGGDIFRQMADERNVTLDELTKTAQYDDSIDKQLDNRLESIIMDYVNGEFEVDGNGLIIESRLAGWHAGDDATVSVFLDAPINIRVNRIAGRDETVSELERREESEAQRYKEYYGIDVTDVSVYDLVINTYENSPKHVITQIKEELPNTYK